MVGFVIATHGSLSKGLLDAVELIAGKQDNIKTVSLDHGGSVEGYTQNFENAIKSANTGKGVLVFLDFFGGTPSNVAASYLKEEGISFVLGVNLPMILEVLYLRDSIELKEMEEKCVNTGRQSIAKLSDKFRDLKLEFKNDF